jgi:uncharacterized protein (DUF1800 family)
MLRGIRRRQPWRLLIGSGVALALTAAVAERTRALQSVGGFDPGPYQLLAHHSGKCLDVSGTALDDSAAVIQFTCHGGQNQQWRVEAVTGGYYRLVAEHSGKVLDVIYASPNDGAWLIQSEPNGGDSQKWAIEPVGGGDYRLLAVHSGKAMDVSGASPDDGAVVIQYTPHGGGNQQWLMRPVSSTPNVPTAADVVRFLEQATFGPTTALIEHVRSIGFQAFLDEQFQAPISSYPTLPLYPATRDTVSCPNGSACQRDNYTMYPLQNRFFVNALYGEDQLRQRVAFALHQILVVSGVDITQPSWMAPYLQTLDRHAFGNYRDLLYDITLNPAMGNYLDVNGNTRTRPNENYAREILQLFSIGTVRLNIDGTPQLDGSGQPIPTYTQETVDNFARVFTGWRFAPAPAPGVPNYVDPMVPNDPQHDTGTKTLLNGATLPANQNTTKDLNDAIDNIFNDSNLGPFISKQLIQHLVTSNPSPEYVARVASVFNGSLGARGDLGAVVRAILLDPEARGDVKTASSYGRLRHPAQLIAGVLRAFGARSADGTSASDGYLNPQSSAMGMDVFRPPSVFSYFSPATVVPGTGGLHGPEFGLFSTSTALRRANFVNTIVFSGIAVSANAPFGTSTDLTPLLPLAASPTDLVDALDDLLLHGSMSIEMHDSIVQAVTAVSSANLLKRARTAVYLILSSSQYQVER